MDQLSWEVLRLAQKMRPLVRQEFGEDIRLAQPDLVERLLARAGRSAGQALRELGEQLGVVLLMAQGDVAIAEARGVDWRQAARRLLVCAGRGAAL